MEELRNKNGYIQLDNLEFEMVNGTLEHLIFYIDGIKHHFKPITDNRFIYNELIAEEIAKDYGIECAHYDLADYKGLKGVISEDVIKDNTYLPIITIIEKYYQYDEDDNKHNNLTDIWDALSHRYNQDITSKLMDEIVNMFLFDILTANQDRNVLNYGILEGDIIPKLAPIFDNENIISDMAVVDRLFCMGVDEDDNMYDNDFIMPDENFIIKFLKESAKEYSDLLESKLWVISDENIEKVLTRVEQRVHHKINKELRDTIKTNFSINYDNVKFDIEYSKGRTI